MIVLIRSLAARPVSVGMVTLAGVVFGVLGFTKLPIELLPDISYPSLTIQTELPDAAPEEVEQLVTWPIEQVVGVVGGLERYHSESRPGVSEVTLEFKWDNDMDAASLDVREKLDLVDLPEDALSPVVYRFDPSLDPMMRLALTGPLPVSDLRKLAETVVRKQLETVPGVAAAKEVGGAEEEVIVDLDEQRLDALGLTVDDVARRIGEENVNRSGGELRSADTAYLVRTVRQFETVAAIEDTILLEAAGGGRVRLGDVGSARLGHQDREVRVRVAGATGVEIHVYKEGDANAVQVARAVRERLAAFRSDRRLAGTQLEILFDQARYIEEAVANVQGTALLGAALAALVLLCFLRELLSTAIIALSIPVSVAVTFLLMHVSGISLNIMSLGGLALGIGMLVDNSVVVLEAVARRREEGHPDPVVTGTAEVVGGIVASTLTTICVFLPLVFVEGVAGELFYDQAMTVTYALVASLFVALTVIPTVLANANVAPRGPMGTFSRWLVLPLAPAIWLVQASLAVLTRVYHKLLGGVVRAPWLAPLAAAVLFVAIVPRAGELGTELVPRLTQGEFFYDLELPEGTPLDVTDAKVADMEAVLAAHAGRFPIVRWFASVGGTPVLGDIRAGDRQDHRARLHVELAPGTPSAVEDALTQSLDEAFAGIPECPLRLGRPSLFSLRDPIEVEVFAARLDDLRAAADSVTQRLAEIPSLLDVRSSVAESSPEVHVALDPVRLASAQLSRGQVADTLAAKGLGLVPTQFTRSEKPIDVRVQARGARAETIADIERRSVRLIEPGRPVLLGSLGYVEEGSGPVAIHHVGGERAASVTARLAGRDLGGASRQVELALAELAQGGSLGARATAQISGQNTEMRESFTSLGLALGLAVFLVYLVLASTFESLRLPFMIVLTVPLGFIGAVLTLWLGDFALGIFALIGVILLCGIVVNNGIIFVARIQQLAPASERIHDAVVAAGRERLRPILITSLTTILGLLPLALGLGAGAELRQPLAVTVVGGLTIGTVLTLLVVPSGYLLLAGRRSGSDERRAA
ncbi:MAG: efflux RND transporter permease subunit [Planctomycetota bacterium]